MVTFQFCISVRQTDVIYKHVIIEYAAVLYYNDFELKLERIKEERRNKKPNYPQKDITKPNISLCRQDLKSNYKVILAFPLTLCYNILTRSLYLRATSNFSPGQKSFSSLPLGEEKNIVKKLDLVRFEQGLFFSHFDLVSLSFSLLSFPKKEEVEEGENGFIP